MQRYDYDPPLSASFRSTRLGSPGFFPGAMLPALLALLALLVLGGCTGDTGTGGAELTKDDARNDPGSAKADGIDYCEYYGWYGDGECDTFCDLADQDCSDDLCTVGADSTCADGEQCLPGYCEFWCPPGAASCCEPAHCEPLTACAGDAECLDGGWCRETADGGAACTPYALEGESCGGFSPTFEIRRCAPGLECIGELGPDGPADAPGTCQAQGIACATNVDCPDTDWCRETQDGFLACTPFAREGDSCGGFTPPWAFEQCAPGLECDEPTASDAPTDIGGVCVEAEPLPEDCRTAGCADGEYCAFCWATFACLPDGAVC